MSSHIVLSLALCLYQRTVASICRVQSQQALLLRRLETISSHRHWVDRTAMPYTHSLTDNRASLLTILMFSTGFWVCSCTVLYTVANTSVFPFLSEDVDPRVDATCVSAEADSVRKHTVALTKKKHCCTDRYI